MNLSKIGRRLSVLKETVVETNYSNSYIALIKYPDLEPIYLGTVYMHKKEYTDEEVKQEVFKLADKYIPKGWTLIKFFKGYISLNYMDGINNAR